MNMKKIFSTFFLTLILLLSSLSLHAQFEEAKIEKISKEHAEWFDKRFSGFKWTGQGLNQQTELDLLDTPEIRARLEAEFGAPTLKIGDLINRDDFRLGQAIQFEYRFVVNDSIPLIVLDVFGPFGRGLSYTGASRYIDLMPQIKRTLSKQLMNEEPAEFHDFYYSADREKWFKVTYINGRYSSEEINEPDGMGN